MSLGFVKFCVAVVGNAVDILLTDYSAKVQARAKIEMYDRAIENAAKMQVAVDNGDLDPGFGEKILEGNSPAEAATAAIEEKMGVLPIDVGARAYSGTSQLSAAGRACVPCGNDHWSTVSGLLSEATRFAREKGLADPEVVLRVSQAEDELNAFERVDAAPQKIVDLPAGEKQIMDEMLTASRSVRHQLSALQEPEDLLQVAADVKKLRDNFRLRVFGMQLTHN